MSDSLLESLALKHMHFTRTAVIIKLHIGSAKALNEYGLRPFCLYKSISTGQYLEINAVSDNAIFGKGFADAVGARIEQTVIHYVDDGLNQPEEHPPKEAE